MLWMKDVRTSSPEGFSCRSLRCLSLTSILPTGNPRSYVLMAIPSSSLILGMATGRLSRILHAP